MRALRGCGQQQTRQCCENRSAAFGAVHRCGTFPDQRKVSDMLPLTRWTVVAAGMLAVLVAVPSAMAGITILSADGSQAPPHQASKIYNIHTGGWDIHLQTLYAPGGVTSYTIRADGGEIIDNLWIDVPCWE